MSSMKPVLMASALVLVAVTAGCGQAVPGKVTLNADHPIVLTDVDGKTFELGNGQATLVFRGSIIAPRLEISSMGNTAEVKIPRKVAREGNYNFYLKAEKIEQQVDLEGKTTFESLGMREERVTESCFGPGWCYVGCGSYNAPCYGPYPGYGYGWSSACPGYRQVRLVYEDSREFLEVKFRDASAADRDVLGVFDGDRGVSSRLVSAQPLEACIVRGY